MTDPDDIPLEPWARELRPKEILYVREYLANNMNSYQALVATGHSRAAAKGDASRWMRKPRIVKAIALAMSERAEALGLTAKTIMSEAFRCYMMSVERGNMSAAARFLEMVGKNCEVNAFIAKHGGLTPTDDEDTAALGNLTDDELILYDRLSRKIAGAGDAPKAAPLYN